MGEQTDTTSQPTAGFDEKALGRAIADARKKAGLTQQQLCEYLDISYSALTKIERGAIKAPSVFTVAQIAQICKVSIESLIGVSSISGALNSPQPHAGATAKARNGIEFVYFDINGCMVRFFQRAFSELARDSGVTPETIEDTFWHYNDAVCRGEMSISEFNRVLGERIGKRDLDWSHYYMDAVDPIMEVHECATWVKSQGFRIGLLSNIMPGFIQIMIRKGLLPDLPYDVIIDSSAVGAIKPETRIYEIAAEQSGVGPEDILLIDDSRTNLMAAERSGWHVLWFDDFRPSESVARIHSTLEL
jgi:FMN phosphatase YigB (HAD superfamily)/DNA-binding XRE family transcriptional regulator